MSILIRAVPTDFPSAENANKKASDDPEELTVVIEDEKEQREASWLLSHFMEVVQVVRCKLCQMSFDNQEQLLSHIRSTHCSPGTSKRSSILGVSIPQIEANESSTGFICGRCSLVLDSLDSCKEHMLQVHNQPLAAPVVPKGVKEAIRSSSSPTEKQPCTYPNCHYQFIGQDLVLHQSCHQGASFQCPQCPEGFKNWRRCALHLWQAHGINVDLLSCPVCPHFKTVFPVKLKNHVSSVHSREEPPKSMAMVNSKRRQCDICSKFFSDSKSLKKHVQAVHGKLRPYICQICNHQSARRTMLEMHMRQHTGEKPFSCDKCQYRTGDHNSLRRHNMRHTGRRPYQCPFCSYSCIQSSPFKCHMEKKHPDEEKKVVFTCETCRFKSINRQAYIDHVSVRHEVDNQPESSDPNECEIPIPVEITPAISKTSPLKARTKLKKRLMSMNRVNRNKETNIHQGAASKSGNRNQSGKANVSGESSKVVLKSKRLAKTLPEDEDSLTCVLGAQDLGGTTIPA